MLIDHSTPQPLSILVWDELAEDACTMLIPVPGQFRPVGLTALRVSSHKGFSMTTSSSTVIIHSPVGEKTEALTAWMTAHHTSLTQLQNRLFNVKLPIPGEKTTKISTLRSKKAKSALQDEKHWLCGVQSLFQTLPSIKSTPTWGVRSVGSAPMSHKDVHTIAPRALNLVVPPPQKSHSTVRYQMELENCQ